MMKQELQPFEREAYEKYLTTLVTAPNDEKALIDSLQKFVPGSDIYQYLYLLTQQKLTEGNLALKDRQLLENYIDRHRMSSDDLKMRQHLLDVDLGKRDVASVISEYFKNRPKSFSKPRNMERQGVAKQGDELTKEDQDQMVKKATLNESIFHYDILKEILDELPKLKQRADTDYNRREKAVERQLASMQTSLMNRLPVEFAHTFDFNLLQPEAVTTYAIQLARQNVLASVVNPSLMTQLLADAGTRAITHKYYFNSELFNNMSLDQVMRFLDKYQNESTVLAAYFSKKYNSFLNHPGGSTRSDQEKYDNVCQLVEAIKHDKYPPQDLRFTILKEMLSYGPKLNVWDQEKFNEMLQIRNRYWQDHSYSHQNGEPSFNIPGLYQGRADNSTWQQYLKHFCRVAGGSLMVYKNMNIQNCPASLHSIEDQTRIEQSKNGLEGLNLNNEWSARKFQEFAEQIQLQFEPHNKDKFAVDEPVVLHLQVKNVPTLHCKVFEFNTLTYYRKTMKPFDTAVDLDGLESTIERKKDFSGVPSNYISYESFEFPELQGKEGLFIIEFVGNGRSARAVVKKGSLSLIHKSTIAGHEATILDDNKQVCKGANTGIFLNKKFIAAEPNGKIFIPYALQQQQHTVIMRHGDFAQLGEFLHKQESYDFDCRFFLNDESVLVGSSATILMTPALKINGRKADLNLIQNIQVHVKTQDFIDRIPTTQTFNGLKIQPGHDLQVSIQIPPNLKFINVELQCQILNTTTKQMLNFNKQKQFDINTFEDSNQVHEYHLRMCHNQKYELLVLGKNGEAKPNMPLSVNLSHVQKGSLGQQLTTCNLGKLYLGTLKNVESVTVANRIFRLPDLDKDEWIYPDQLDRVVGGSLEVPVASLWNDSEELTRELVTLVRKEPTTGHVLNDCYDQVKLVKKASENSHYYSVQVANLLAGKYDFRLRAGHQTLRFQINVHEGEFLGNLDSMILKRDKLQELVQSQKELKINTSKMRGDNKLQINLADYSENARVHCVATHFIPSNCYSLFTDVAQMLQNSFSTSAFPFAQWSNMLLSNRHLSDEYRYVFDRTGAERTLGNSLDRPSLLNKRLFVRKTEQDEEKLSKGNEYEKKNEKVMAQQVQQQNYRMNAAPGAPARAVRTQSYITDYQNFLKDAPITAFNLKPDAQGVVTFENDKMSQYSTVQIVVIDDNSAVQSTRCLNQAAEPAMRDLSLKKSLNESKGMTESRQNKNLLTGASDFIEDITSSQVMMVDDLTKVQQIMSELNIGQEDPAKWKELDFVNKWSTQTTKQKNFLFGAYQCHEINYFLKKHDNEYFEQVVRGFLSQKMEKSFVDLYLLDMDALILQKYGKKVYEVLKMNSFEKCLMLEVYMRNNQKEVAKRIADQMRQQQQADYEEDYQMMQHRFDLVLNMNSTQKQKMPLQQHQEREMKCMAMAAPSAAPRMMAKQCFVEEEEDCDMGAAFGGDEYGDYGASIDNEPVQYMAKRAENFAIEKFEKLENTCEYMETFYYNSKLKHSHECRYLTTENRFWLDLADHIVSQPAGTPFVTHNFTDVETSMEKFLVKVVMDLPWVTSASAHKLQADSSRGLTITAGSNVIIYKKEIKEVEVSIKQDFMVTHRYQRIDDYGRQHRSDDDDAIPAEFLINTPYECEVIMTNVSPNQTQFNLLYQVPIGSMPIKRTKFMKSETLTLGSYSTERLTFHFYFPQIGQFGHYPSNVSIDEKVTARGQANQLKVVTTRKINKENVAELNFDDLIQVGTDAQILDYLRTKNICSNEKGFSFSKIQHLLMKKEFYHECIDILRSRAHYNSTVWEFSKNHNDKSALREQLMLTQELSNNLTCFFESSLIDKSPLLSNKHFHRMLEYNPMINSRAHAVGEHNSKKILNKTFRQTYDQFLQTMAFKSQLSFGEKLIFVYYLQLQDRIPEALKVFDKVEQPASDEEADVNELDVQYDYLRAYFDFFTGAESKYSVARRVVQRYDNYPVSHWKMMFLAIEDQLNDFDGEFDMMGQEEDIDGDSAQVISSEAAQRERKQENLKNSKAKEPQLSQTSIDDKGALQIESVNIKTVAVKYYMIDAEILFSRAPFLKNNTEEFSYVKPFLQLDINMFTAAEDSMQYMTKNVQLPESLVNHNLVIEISAEGQQQFKTFYSSELKVQINQAFGELKVIHNAKNEAMGKVYVKVFQRDRNGKEVFYRDGYTDIRGKFEYAQTSGDKLKDVRKFAILVQSEQFGSMIKEVDPPKDESVASATGGGNVSSMLQAKQERIMNRNQFVQSKRQQ